MPGARVVGAILAGLAIALVLMVGSIVLVGFWDAGITDNAETVEIEATDTWIEVGQDGRGVNERVYDSTGTAVELSGSSSSYFSADQDLTFTEDANWTVSTWADADSDVSGEHAVVSLDGRVVIAYDAATDEWVGWYYDESTTASYELRADAQSQPSSMENVQFASNGSHLALYADSSATPADTEALDGSSYADAPDAQNWDGEIDEVRTWGVALDETNRSAVRDDPTGPLPGTNRTSRIMFDEHWDPHSQHLLFADGRVDLHDASIDSGGLAGTQMERGEDYEWRVGGSEVAILSSGRLAQDPVAYVLWDDSETTTSDVEDAWWSFSELGTTLMLLVMAVSLIGVVRLLQQ